MANRLAALVSALLVALCGDVSAQQPQPATPRTRALLVGCDEYPNLRAALGERYDREVRLRGPANDVALLETTLERTLGLTAENRVVLAGWPENPRARPTRANILAGLERLAHEATAGDLVVVYLAGHGTQQRVQRIKPDEEPDQLEEIFLPADVRPAEQAQEHVPGSIRDDELGERVRAIRDAGAQVFLIVDSCHSGTMLRGDAEAVRLRGLDPALLGIPSTRGGRGSGSNERGWLDGDDVRGIAALYGATSYGRAPEMVLPREGGPDDVHGLFTYLLCGELERLGARTSYRELAGRVVAAYQAFPCSITVPTAEGDLDRCPGGERALAPPLLCRLRDGAPFLDQGLVGGLEPGVQVRVFALDGGAERSVALVEIVEAELFESRAKLIDGELAPGGGAWRARPEARRLSDQRLRLGLVYPDGSRAERGQLPERVRAELERQAALFPIVDDPRDADWYVVLAADELWLRPGPREGGHDLCDVPADGVLGALTAIQRSRNLRRFAGSGLTAPWQEDLALRLERRDQAGWRELERDGVLHPGDRIRLRAEKSTDAIYDVNVFFLDAAFGTQLVPPSSGTPRLPSSARAGLDLAGELTVTDESLGVENLLVFATPRSESSPVIDLTALEQRGATRGAPLDPFEQLLGTVLRGEATRGAPAQAMDARGTRGRLLTLRTGWGTLGPPRWPTKGMLGSGPDARPMRDRPHRSGENAEGVPDPWSSGPRAALLRSSRERARPDVLLLGDADVEAVLIDLDAGVSADAEPSTLARERSFDAEAAFVFGERSFAFYDRTDRGLFDLALEDADGDGVADRRWTRTANGEWRCAGPVSLPWLSQAHLRGGAWSRVDVTARFRVLQRSE